MWSFSGVWGTWAKILAAVVVLLLLSSLVTLIRARSSRSQRTPGKTAKWDKHRQAVAIVQVLCSTLLLIIPFITDTISKNKPPLSLILLGAFGIVVGAVRLFAEYAQKRGEARRADEAWTQKIRSLVARWPLPRASEVNPYDLLGVTESKVASQYAKKGERPPYIFRDIDSELDKALTTSDFVLLVGHSKSGKSRTAFEAVLRLFPQQWVIIPSNGKALAELFCLEPPLEIEPGPAIVWLDDLQRFLGPNGLTPSLLNWLSQENGRIKVLATLTSKRHDDYLLSTSDIDKDSQLILQRFQQIVLTSNLSPAEAQRAQAAYPQEAPEKLAASLGEHLIAAHALTNKYEMSKESRPQGHALVRAAIDWRRVGILRPIPETSLRKLAEQYLGFLKLPNIDLTQESFKDGLQWAREPVGLHVALLSKVGEDGQEKLFEAFDYLVDHVERQTLPIPDPAWESILGFAAPSDALQMGRFAYRGHHRVIARKALEKAIQSGDLDIVPQASFVLGVICQDAQDTDEAERLYRVSIGSKHLDIAGMAKINLGKILMDRGDLPEAEQFFREVINSKQADIARKATVNLGVVHLRRGELGEAERIFREGINAPEEDVAAIAKVNLGRIFLDQGALTEAERLFREVDPARPATAAMAMGGIGTIHLLRGDLTEAERCFREVTQSNHPDAVAMAASNLGAIHLQRNELAEAERLFRDLRDSKNAAAAAMATANLGVIHLRRDELSEAERLFREAIDSKQPDAVAIAKANLSLIHLKRNEQAEAERLFREVINSKQPDAIDVAQSNFSKFFMQRGELAEAERFLREAISASQKGFTPSAAANLGIIHLMRGELVEAEFRFHEAIRSRHPEATTIAMFNLGLLHMRRDELDEAERLFQELTSNPEPTAAAMAKTRLSDIQLRRSEMANADRMFHAALTSRQVGAAAMGMVHLDVHYGRAGGSNQPAKTTPSLTLGKST